VAAAWGLSPAQLCGPSRQRQLVTARQVVIYLARNMLALSWAEAAQLVGRSDHTTAISGYRRVVSVLATDSELASRVAWITASLQRPLSRS